MIHELYTKYSDNPRLALKYIFQLLTSREHFLLQDPTIDEIHKLLFEIISRTFSLDAKDDPGLPEQNNLALKSEIKSFYLRQELLKAILHLGYIPKDSYETTVGVGFIDIADYSYLSNWLSPKENQAVLNGLYSAFNLILKKHGGYLNKMEGDSLMFHFGGLIDSRVKDLNQDELEAYLARELFYTCIEMQQVSFFFNQADKRFITEDTDEETRYSLQAAFHIIHTLRENLIFSSSVNAMFQIRIRVGAGIGEVCIGNFGPKGAKQWDIIGNPVIEAKRMEMTAPSEGIRISENLYRLLEKTGVSNQYFREFRAEARERNGFFGCITKKDLFQAKVVRIKEKKNIQFNSYRVFVNPSLPEIIAEHTEALLFKQEGVNKIIEMIQYHRGNKYVINALEALLVRRKIEFNKAKLLKIIMPFRYNSILKNENVAPENLSAYINDNFSLFYLVNTISRYQDHFRNRTECYEKKNPVFTNNEQNIEEGIDTLLEDYRLRKKYFDQSIFFQQVVYPGFFHILKAGILEYQKRIEDAEPEEIAV